MFKFAALIATVAATAETTVKTDAKKADSDVHKAAAHVKSTAKNAVLSGSADSSTDITSLTKSQTQEEIHKSNSVGWYKNDDGVNCANCLFAGGDFTASVKEVKEVKAVKGVKADAAKKIAGVTAVAGVKGVAAKDGDCVFGGQGFAATSAKDTDPAARWADLTNKDMFHGLRKCNNGGKISSHSGLQSTYDYATMMDKAATFNKTTHLGAKWDDSWGSYVHKGEWGYIRTVMPKSFDGGLRMSVDAAKDSSTKYTIRIDGLTERYFNEDTMVAAGLGNTHVVELAVTHSIEVVATFVGADDVRDPTFKVNFQRISKEGMAIQTLKHGGVIVWVVIGCVLLCLIIVGVIFWKKCSKKEEFYNSDDLYARV